VASSVAARQGLVPSAAGRAQGVASRRAVPAPWHRAVGVAAALDAPRRARLVERFLVPVRK